MHLHSDSGLNPTGRSVHLGGHPQVIQRLVLLPASWRSLARVHGDILDKILRHAWWWWCAKSMGRSDTIHSPDGVLGVDPAPLHVPLRQALLEPGLLLLLVLLSPLAHPVQLLRGELQLEQDLIHVGSATKHPAKWSLKR